MIEFQDVSYLSPSGGGQKVLLSTVNLAIPTNTRVALLGPSESDKRILMDLLGHIIVPDQGRIIRDARVSFPSNHFIASSNSLSIRSNLEHLARLYDADPDKLSSFVEKYLELGPFFNNPYKDLPTEIRLPLSVVVTLSLPFDVYLISSDYFGPDKNLADRCLKLLITRGKDAGLIIQPRNLRFARQLCEMALVLNKGLLVLHDSIQGAHNRPT